MQWQKQKRKNYCMVWYLACLNKCDAVQCRICPKARLNDWLVWAELLMANMIQASLFFCILFHCLLAFYFFAWLIIVLLIRSYLQEHLHSFFFLLHAYCVLLWVSRILLFSSIGNKFAIAWQAKEKKCWLLTKSKVPPLHLVARSRAARASDPPHVPLRISQPGLGVVWGK